MRKVRKSDTKTCFESSKKMLRILVKNPQANVKEIRHNSHVISIFFQFFFLLFNENLQIISSNGIFSKLIRERILKRIREMDNKSNQRMLSWRHFTQNNFHKPKNRIKISDDLIILISNNFPSESPNSFLKTTCA